MIDTRQFKEPILMFSGGKDSLLVLLKLKDRLDHINVVFVNTGKSFPEALSFIDTIKEMCPKFIELKSDRDYDWGRYGMPSDLIPQMYTQAALDNSAKSKFILQSVFSCCYKNIMLPVINLAQALDSTLLIRGSKFSDKLHDSYSTGSMVGKVTLYNPIEDLTDYQVLEALKTFDHDIDLPDYYSFEHSSLDCMDCTGYLDKTKDRLELLKKHYPYEYGKTKANIEKIIAISETTLESIKKAII